jgi:hypothetical protein
LETRADARFHVSDLCCRHNAAAVSLRSIYQAAAAANYTKQLSASARSTTVQSTAQRPNI